MNACPFADELLRLLDGELTTLDNAWIETHIEHCEECRVRLERLTRGCLASGEDSPLDAVDAARGPNPRETKESGDRLEVAPGDDTEEAVGLGETVVSDTSRTNPGAWDAGRASPDRGTGVPAQWPIVPGYDTLEWLGEGGMGVVYKAQQLGLNRPVALKMIRGGSQERPDYLARFRAEAATVARLRHPNIIQIYDIGEAGGLPFVALELLDGSSLADRLAGNPQPGRQAAELMVTLAGAVQVAHEAGIIHRDLKPSNVLYTADGVPKITDFGLAKRVGSDEGQTQSGQIMGSPGYMAPEQARGHSRHVGPAADVYALGAILYEMLTGRPPFKGATPMETVRHVIDDDPVPPSRLVPRVPRDLEVICLKCLHKEPHRRYPSAAALAEDLHRFQRGEAITARPTGRSERLARWLRRRRVQVAAVSVGMLLGIVLVAAGLGLRSVHEAGVRRERDRARREQALAARADAIHLERATLVEGRFNPVAERRFNDARADRDYESAFRDGGFGAIGEEPAVVAARVAASAAREPLVAALDDWAFCADDERRRARVLGVARRSDPDAWRARARDPAAWADRDALAALARAAPVAVQPAHVLVALGERLHDLGGDGTAVLARVHEAHPDDFWAALALARALQEGPAPEAAVAPYRRALELRGDAAAVYNNLGLIPFARRDWHEAYDEYEKALEIDRDFAPAHNNFGLACKGEGKWDEAIHHFREAVRLNPDLAPAHYNLGEIRAYQGGLDEAVDHYRWALRIDPEFARAEYLLGVALAGRGRLDEANDRDRRALRDDPAGARSLSV